MPSINADQFEWLTRRWIASWGALRARTRRRRHRCQKQSGKTNLAAADSEKRNQARAQCPLRPYFSPRRWAKGGEKQARAVLPASVPHPLETHLAVTSDHNLYSLQDALQESVACPTVRGFRRNGMSDATIYSVT